MIQILFSEKFRKNLKKLNRYDINLVLEKLDKLSKGSEGLDVKKMEPKHLNNYRLRAGKYRIIFCYSSENEILLLKIDKRDKIYLRPFN